MSVAVGLIASVVAYSVLGSLRTDKANTLDMPPETASPRSPGAGLSPESIAPRIAPGRVALAAPTAGLELLAVAVQPGDRLAVIAVIPNPPGSMAAMVVREAVVLGRPTVSAGSPFLLEMTPEEAMVLVHLIQSGARLDYALWPAAGTPRLPGLLDLEAARARLGLDVALPPRD